MNKKELSNLIKRFFLTFLCCIPIFIALNYVLKNKASNFVIIIINVVVGAVVFALEELTHSKIVDNRKIRKQKYEKEQKDK